MGNLDGWMFARRYLLTSEWISMKIVIDEELNLEKQIS